MTPLETQMQKAIPHDTDGYYLERLLSFPEGEWFTPTSDGDGNDFSLCLDLSSFNLIQKKNTPLWHNGSFKGNLIQFRYRKDLEYGK